MSDRLTLQFQILNIAVSSNDGDLIVDGLNRRRVEICVKQQ